MDKLYDFVIVGSGPSSLALATLLSKKYSNILILEKNNFIGGLNGVFRGHNNAFEEHSPRIISSAYSNFISILNDMDMDFNELFDFYKLPALDTLSFFSYLSIPTLLRFTIAFIIFLFNKNYGYDIPLIDITNGSDGELKFLNRICRLVDGGTIYNTRLNQILQISNQNLLYGFYQPKVANDIGLFKQWKDYLENKGVEFKLNIEVTDISNKKINNTYNYNNLVLAIPPGPLSKLLPEYKSFAEKTKYSHYIPITLHWLNTYKISDPIEYDLKDKLGMLSVVTSNYTEDPISPYKTVISSVISNVKEVVGLTEDEIKHIAYQQLKMTIPDLNNIPEPDMILIHHESNEYGGAYFDSVGSKHISFQTKFKNVYALGTMNGNSDYAFTSVESAVSNAVVLAKKFGIRKTYKSGWTIRGLIGIIILLLCIYKMFY